MYVYKFGVDDGEQRRHVKWLTSFMLCVGCASRASQLLVGCLFVWVEQFEGAERSEKKEAKMCTSVLLPMKRDEET